MGVPNQSVTEVFAVPTFLSDDQAVRVMARRLSSADHESVRTDN